MSEEASRRYADAYKPLASAVPCFAGAVFYFNCYLKVATTKSPSVTLPGLGAIVYQFGGLVALVAASAAFAVAFLILTGLGLKRISILRREIGSEAVDLARLERARESTRRHVILGKPPKHLESLEAFRAYYRRIRFMLTFFVLFFGLVILGAYLKVI